MLYVRYEEYTNDFTRRYCDKSFASFDAFADWLFGLCDGLYEERISIPDPTRCRTGPYRIEVNCYRAQNKCYWVHQIERDGKIIFSDGKFTSGQKHWNEEVQKLCANMIRRRNQPVFNFG